MELKHIKELMTAMGRSGTKRLMLKKEGFELELEREENGSYKQQIEPAYETYEENTLKNDIERHRTTASISRHNESKAAHTEIKEDVTSSYVTSPMVGTYYSTPSPEDPEFVKVGDQVDKNTVVGIIEAMKVMNEIKAGISGTIVEVLVENGHPVEFGTKLFRIN